MMKTILKANIILTFLIFILFIANVNAQQNSHWEILNEGGDFGTIDFINKDIGWIIGGNGFFKTEDGQEIKLLWDLLILIKSDF